ncbi:PP2C family protein-serine/threonine phosphatase [Luteolibacter sp. AS25]|uniref:PP2C family protein-serine/threonine phosphatase n=1 Tax=Luteolibacter sp. AS25 TaxID=3135776 RepID=UPI00398A564C
MKNPSTDTAAPSDTELFAFLLENTTDHVYFKDRDGRFIRHSRAVAEYMKADPSDLIGRTDFDFWSEETARETAADEQGVIDTGKPLVGKIERLIYPDGRVAWGYTSKFPLKNSNGEIIGVCGINKDFTEIKEMEMALEQKNNQIQADLEMARKVQEALLPDEDEISIVKGGSGLVIAHHYRPAAAVGGDFFHIVPLSRGRVGVLICDVMGHGVKAALITGIIRGLLDELRPHMLYPGRFLSALNNRVRAVLEHIDEPFIATAFYFVADPAKGQIRFASAGHPKPVCLRQGKGMTGLLGDGKKRSGPAIGLMKDAVFPAQTKSFEKDDRIVLFTDGIFEMEDADENEFGVEAFYESLSKHSDLPAVELFAAVLEDVRKFSGKTDFVDDVCMVSIRQS